MRRHLQTRKHHRNRQLDSSEAECAICAQTISEADWVQCVQCVYTWCTMCQAQLTRCPFCRQGSVPESPSLLEPQTMQEIRERLEQLLLHHLRVVPRVAAGNE